MDMRKSRLVKEKQERLMEHFVSGSTARCASELVNANKNTAAYFFHRLREINYQAIEEEAPFLGDIEVGESYFGGVRKGKRGRGATGKVLVFRLLKRGDRVYAKVIPDTKSKTLMGIIQKKIVPDSIVYSDGYHSCNVLDVSEFKHYRINHSKLFADKQNHIYGTRPRDICVDLTVFPSSIFLYF
jgi:transposase